MADLRIVQAFIETNDPFVLATARILHERWCSAWKAQKGGESVPRLKPVSDGGPLVDINVPFVELHPEWQAENLAAAKAAKAAVTLHPDDTAAAVEAAAAFCHAEWMKRATMDAYNSALFVDYTLLPEVEKDKDREHVWAVREAIDEGSEVFLPPLSSL